jgi:hypothetical protein
VTSRRAEANERPGCSISNCCTQIIEQLFGGLLMSITYAQINNGHSSAPPASTPPDALRLPPSGRLGEPCLAPPAGRLQEDGEPAEVARPRPTVLGRVVQGVGRAGGRLSSSCHPTPSCGGSAAASASTGPASPLAPWRDARAQAASSGLSSYGWLRPILCGARLESTANCRSWESTSLSAPSPACSRSAAHRRRRRDARS